MNVEYINGNEYRLPGRLNEFQRQLYIHLIDWKRTHITVEPGCFQFKGQMFRNDSILPKKCALQEQPPHVYTQVHAHLRTHRKLNPYRIHKHFYHMASSQAANINLFLPILHSPLVNRVLSQIKRDFKELAVDQLDKGYCIEYWGGNFQGDTAGQGLLGDKTTQSGTDADLAIAYRNHSGELCLWLIEHKLTEPEFTTCGGFKSKGRQASHDCTRCFSDILDNKATCYYHDVRKFKYWDITDAHKAFFCNHSKFPQCPFKGGLNQLWRNQLLALAIEQDERQPFVHATFSVVRHPRNQYLNTSLNAFKDLVNNNPKFTVFTSEDVLPAAENLQDYELNQWAAWYRDLYML